MVVARAQWYEVHCQLPFQIEAFANHSRIDVCAGVKILAMKQTPDLPQSAVHRLAVGSCLLYICVHNPMTDLHILEIKELLMKASREIVLLLILPVCESFSVALDKPSIARLHVQRDARFVSTIADMSCWLTMLGAGLFSSVVVVLPYHDLGKLKGSCLWKSMEDTTLREIVDEF